MHMSGIRLIDELTCCRDNNTATLRSCVAAEKSWHKQTLLHAVQERHLDSLTSAVAIQTPVHERQASRKGRSGCR
jgi:hypothetical protein